MLNCDCFFSRTRQLCSGLVRGASVSSTSSSIPLRDHDRVLPELGLEVVGVGALVGVHLRVLGDEPGLVVGAVGDHEPDHVRGLDEVPAVVPDPGRPVGSIRSDDVVVAPQAVEDRPHDRIHALCRDHVRGELPDHDEVVKGAVGPVLGESLVRERAPDPAYGLVHVVRHGHLRPQIRGQLRYAAPVHDLVRGHGLDAVLVLGHGGVLLYVRDRVVALIHLDLLVQVRRAPRTEHRVHREAPLLVRDRNHDPLLVRDGAVVPEADHADVDRDLLARVLVLDHDRLRDRVLVRVLAEVLVLVVVLVRVNVRIDFRNSYRNVNPTTIMSSTAARSSASTCP
ncbi:hypothetical protein PG995_009149 [Apiospora arundinis]